MVGARTLFTSLLSLVNWSRLFDMTYKSCDDRQSLAAETWFSIFLLRVAIVLGEMSWSCVTVSILDERRSQSHKAGKGSASRHSMYSLPFEGNLKPSLTALSIFTHSIAFIHIRLSRGRSKQWSPVSSP